MSKWLAQVRQKNLYPPPSEVPKVPKVPFGTFGTDYHEGSQLFAPLAHDPFGTFGTEPVGGAEVFSPAPDATIAARYPPDELGEPCPDCGSQEKWVWLDERRLCRPCLIRGEPPSSGKQHKRIM